jgi:hypothetical protein
VENEVAADEVAEEGKRARKEKGKNGREDLGFNRGGGFGGRIVVSGGKIIIRTGYLQNRL